MTLAEAGTRPEQARIIISCAALVGACRELMVRSMEEDGAAPLDARAWARRLANRLDVGPGDLPEEGATPEEVALWSVRPLGSALARHGEERALRRLAQALSLERLFQDRSLVGIVSLACGFGWPWATYPALLRLTLAPEERELGDVWLEAAGIPKLLEAAAEGGGPPASPLPEWAAVRAFGAVFQRLRERARVAERRVVQAGKELREAVRRADRLAELLAAERRARAEAERALREKASAEPRAPAPCPACADLTERLAVLAGEAEALRREAAAAARRAEETEANAELALEAMRDALAQAWAGREDREDPPAAEAGAVRPLVGLRIAVVGDPGRREEYRRLVEEAGAEYLFQDGCDGEARAEERLAGADGIVALCDWLNHKLFGALRRIERGRGVPVVYRPTNGLASARRGLAELAARLR